MLKIRTGMFFTLIKSGSTSLLLIVASVLPCLGQVIQPARFELVLEDRTGIDNPQVEPLGKHGALIYRRIREKAKDRVELIKMDTSLQENWRGSIIVDKNLAIAKVEAYEQFVFILFNSVLYGGFDFNVVAVNIQTQDFSSYIIKNLIPLKPTEFKASTRSLLIGGYFNNIPVVLHYNLALGQSRLLPGFFNDPGELNQIKMYDDGLIDIIVSTKNLQRKKIVWLRSYSPEGDLINSTILQDVDKNLQFGTSTRKPDGTVVVSGTYNVRNSDYSKGIYYTEVNPDMEHTIRYHDFTDLENFFKYMKPAREARVKRNIANRKLKGKKIHKTYFFLPHEIQPYGDNYLMIGEVYYPRYYYLNTLGYTTRANRIFDGYRYTHASIVGFNERGDLQWDNSLEINDIKTFSLIQYVKVANKDENLGLIYLYEDELRTKTIIREKVIEGKSITSLSLKSGNDSVKEKNSEFSFLEYWYQPYFLAYGIQNVRNSLVSTDEPQRKVLFINKLKFQ
jgi:hypothetical protein